MRNFFKAVVRRRRKGGGDKDRKRGSGITKGKGERVEEWEGEVRGWDEKVMNRDKEESGKFKEQGTSGQYANEWLDGEVGGGVEIEYWESK